MSHLKLSEAIRLGAMMKPQGHFGLFDGGKTCAIGAALDAVGELNNALSCAMPYEYAAELWPILRAETSVASGADTESFIIFASDVQCLSREAIADKVEQIEQYQASLVTPESVTV